ncbi:MAG: hypothetical protein KDD62_04755 [Bdellovibrionales bacterium]|nr:hypothetical protein [Bdellovibrionales bacterium]
MIKVVRKWWSAWGTLPVITWVKAAAYYKAGQFEVAKAYYERGLQRHPQHPAADCARMDASYCLFRMRDFVGAEKHLRVVLNNMPENKDASIRLARLHLWTGNYVEAAWTISASA